MRGDRAGVKAMPDTTTEERAQKENDMNGMQNMESYATTTHGANYKHRADPQKERVYTDATRPPRTNLSRSVRAEQ